MFKLLFNKSFKKTNDCIILATPLIIFLSIFGIYFSYSLQHLDNINKLILFCVTCVVMASGLMSAWFYMFQKALRLSGKYFLFDRDRSKELLTLIFSVPKGIGKYFLSFTVITTGSFLLYSIVSALITYFVELKFGNINLEILNISSSYLTGQNLTNYLSSIPKHDIIVLNIWLITLFIGYAILSYLMMFWIPEVLYKNPNPFKSFLNSLGKVFKIFPKTLFAFIYLNLLYFILSIVTSLLMVHPLLYFFVLILFYYFIIYFVMVIFLLYEQEFCKNEQ